MAISSRLAPAATLSRAQVLELLAELLAGFGSDDFQCQLQELAKINSAKGGTDLRSVEGRQALALAVQREVLPRYGFDGDELGVLAMKRAVRLHMGDPRVARKSMDIRDKLLIPEVRRDVPASPTARPVVPAANMTAPEPECTCVLAQPIKSITKKEEEVEISVVHTQGKGQLKVRVPVADATILRVKEAVVEALGRGSVAELQLVMWGGGMFVNHRDSDVITTERVFSTGLDLRCAN